MQGQHSVNDGSSSIYRMHCVGIQWTFYVEHLEMKVHGIILKGKCVHMNVCVHMHTIKQLISDKKSQEVYERSM